jgi:hypothetical protein
VVRGGEKISTRIILGKFFLNRFEAAEQRPIVAHGKTVGLQPQIHQAPERGERNFHPSFSTALPGLDPSR